MQNRYTLKLRTSRIVDTFVDGAFTSITLEFDTDDLPIEWRKIKEAMEALPEKQAEKYTSKLADMIYNDQIKKMIFRLTRGE